MATLTLRNGTVLTQVTRASCLARIAAIPLESIWYSQTTISPITDRRADCSGAKCYCWATPKTGPGTYLNAHNTGSLVTQQLVRRISWDELLPGDAVGYLAPNGPGNGGHVATWLGGDRRPDGTLDVWDHGSGMGPKRRKVRWNGNPDSWLAPRRPDGSPGFAPWRYVGIIEEEGDDMPLTSQDVAAVWSATFGRGEEQRTVGVILQQACSAAEEAQRQAAAAAATTADLRVKVDLILAKLDKTVEQVRAVVDEELDEQSRSGADDD